MNNEDALRSPDKKESRDGGFLNLPDEFGDNKADSALKKRSKESLIEKKKSSQLDFNPNDT